MSDTYSHSVLASPAALLPMDARLTEIDPPGGDGAQAGALAYAYHFLGMSEVYNNNYTGPDAALCYSAVWGCVRAITQGLAPLSWHTYERSADGRLRIPVEDPTAWIIDLQANPEMSALAWREVMLKDALTSPGGFSEIERTAAGRPNWLWPLAQGRVCPDRLESGELIYEVENGSGQKNTILTPMQVFHVKGITYDGVVGYDLIELMRRAIKLGLQEEQFGSQVFGKGPLPGGIVSVPGNMTREQRTEFRKGFEQAYTGQANAGRIIVLSNGVTFSAASLPNDSAQFLESRRYQVSEICRFYGVPPHKLADLERATFSNIEEQEIAFVRDCLLPWARRLETEADIKLFGPVQRGRRFTKLNLDALMRGNSATQTQTVTSKVSAGLMTINEGRTYFDLNPIDGGDTALIQGAMVRLEDVIDPPEPVAPEPAPAALPAPTKEAAPDAPEKDTEKDGKSKGAKKQVASGGDVQATALNGAQIAALIDLAGRLAIKEMPQEGVRAMMEAVFPLMDRDLIDTIVTELGKFTPPTPVPAPAPAPKAAPAAPAPAPSQAQTRRMLAAGRVFATLLESVYADVLRIEADKARRAVNKGPSAVSAYVCEYYDTALTTDHLCGMLRPIFAGLALAAGGSEHEAEALAAEAARLHVARSKAELLAAPRGAIEEWLKGRAAEQAARSLTLPPPRVDGGAP